MEYSSLPIPEKRYFTISEVSKLCGVKPHVLRYWEQEFTQLNPIKRRGNRRYYQLHEVELIRQIRQLLHDQGFTIVGARNKLQEIIASALAESVDNDSIFRSSKSLVSPNDNASNFVQSTVSRSTTKVRNAAVDNAVFSESAVVQSLLSSVRRELMSIRDLLEPTS